MADPAGTEALDALADALYSAPPADFVAVRDEAVRAARERGDRGFAAAAARLRRPTRAAWLANLLARHRREQLDGLLALAGTLADAQRTLDGDALRALSAQRRLLVAAMAREAGRLARDAHEPVNDSVLRELGDILEAALADPVVADEVCSGRSTRTVSYSGFGPDADPGAAAAARERAVAARPEPVGDDAPDPGPTPAEQAEAARRDRERESRRRDLADAERAEAAARERREAAESAHEAAVGAHEAARERVSRLTAELDAAQQQERAAAAAGREAAAAARTAAREAGTAATRTARARARLDDVPPSDAAVSGDTPSSA